MSQGDIGGGCVAKAAVHEIAPQVVANRLLYDDDADGDTAAAAMAAAAAAAARASLRVFIAKRMDFWAPKAKRALATCLLDAPSDSIAGIKNAVPSGALLTVSVEAVASGTVILPALSVDRETTVGRLKRLLKDVAKTPSSLALRLFVGHGGMELSDDARCVCEYDVPDGATLVQVTIGVEHVTLLLSVVATTASRYIPASARCMLRRPAVSSASSLSAGHLPTFI